MKAYNINMFSSISNKNSDVREKGDMWTLNHLLHNIVSLQLCKEYLTAVKFKTQFLLVNPNKVLNVLIGLYMNHRITPLTKPLKKM